MRSGKLRDADYLEHIANRIARIERATAQVDLAGFLGNEDLQAALERYITEPQRQAHSQEPESAHHREDLGR